MRKIIFLLSLVLLFISCTSKNVENLIKAVKNSQAAGERRGEEDETQELLMKI